MTVIILATNGGPHPPDKWAALAADQISNLVYVADNSDSEAATAARKAKPRFAIAVSDALELIFKQAMDAESAAVSSGSVKVRHAPFDVEEFVDGASSAVLAVAGQFSAHFALPNVAAVVRNILTQNIIDAANIARSWALDAKGL